MTVPQHSQHTTPRVATWRRRAISGSASVPSSSPTGVSCDELTPSPKSAILSVLPEMSMFSVTVFIAGLVSTETLAAIAIAMQTSGIGFIVPFGIAQAATVRIGRAAGARDAAGIGTATATAACIGLVWIVFASAAIWFGAPLIVDGFLDLSDPATAPLVPIALGLLAITAIFQMFDTTQAIASGVLRGLKDTRVPMVYAVIGYWGIGLPAAILLAFTADLGGDGIWWGMTVGLAAASVLLVTRVVRRL